jgi:sialidase-1
MTLFKKVFAGALVSSLFLAAVSKGQTSVFISGHEGYRSFRIPAILSWRADTLLAFCEGRVKGSADFGDVDIVMKRSTDGGQTWSALQNMVDYGALQAGNPAPVVDLTDPAYPRGRIFLFYNTGNHHEQEVRKGNGLREVWYITSTDAGQSWSQPVNITTQVHKPNQPAVNAEYRFAEDWRSYANTPGHAIQLKQGQYRGRLYVAANHSAGPPLPKFEDYRAHGYYSDDHGKTFQLSTNVELPGSNEAMAAELYDGRLVMNIRNQQGEVRRRIVAISSNGGNTWDSAWFHPQLIDPVCQGSLLTIGRKGKHSILAFCNPASTTRRDSLTLRISYNSGSSWDKQILLDANPSVDDYTAYSDLVLLSDGSLGVLYERNNYGEIVFRRIAWKSP